MILFSPPEIAFYIFKIPVYWYGVVIAMGVFVGVLVAEFLSDKNYIPKNFFIDNSPIIILLGLIGARLYYCILNYDYYSVRLAEVFDVRQGGLSIHGMLILGFICVFLLAKFKKIQLFKLLDVLACSVCIGQVIGRWGNFFNNEAFGVPTYSNWGLYIPITKRPEIYSSYEFFHPTFLYESIINFFIFFILIFILKKQNNSGITFFSYLILYSIGRIFVEYLRIDSVLNILGFPIAQVVSLLFILIGVGGLVFVNKKCN